MKLNLMLFFCFFIVMILIIFYVVRKKISKNWIFEKKWIFSQLVGISISTSMAVLCIGMASFFITDLANAAIHIFSPESFEVKDKDATIDMRKQNAVSSAPLLKVNVEKERSYLDKSDYANAKKDLPQEKDMIGLSMTAVATAITAITFVLGLGTTWFSEKLKLLDEERIKLEKSEKRRTKEIEGAIKKLDEQFSSYEKLKIEQLEQNEKYNKWRIYFDLASDDILDWIGRKGGDHMHWNIFVRINKSLRSLHDSNVEKRMFAFGQLITFLPDVPGDDLTHVRAYCDFCYKKHARSENEVRVWCDIFNQVERSQYAKDMSYGGVEY